MKGYISLILFCVVTIGCKFQTRTERTIFELKVDSIKHVIPLLSVKDTIDFNNIAKNVFGWEKSKNIVMIDSLFYDQYFKNFAPIGRWSGRLQASYFYGAIDLLNSLVILRKISDDMSDMFLVQFDKNGEIEKYFLLAAISKSPDDYVEIKSIVDSNILITFKIHYIDEADGNTTIKRDTTRNILW